jgi:hypothetical protein
MEDVSRDGIAPELTGKMLDAFVQVCGALFISRPDLIEDPGLTDASNSAPQTNQEAVKRYQTAFETCVNVLVPKGPGE